MTTTFIFELYSANEKRILTQTVSGARFDAVLEQIAKTMTEQEQRVGKVSLKMISASQDGVPCVDTPVKLESLNSLVTLATEHYHQKTASVIVKTTFDPTAGEKLGENLKTVLINPKQRKKLTEALKKPRKRAKIIKELDISVEKGDVLLAGKYKNKKCVVKGFDTDENNQPVAKTDRGDQKILKPRLEKLMPVKESESALDRENKHRNSPPFKNVIKQFKLKPFVEGSLKTKDHHVHKSQKDAVSKALTTSGIPHQFQGQGDGLYGYRLSIDGHKPTA